MGECKTQLKTKPGLIDKLLRRSSKESPLKKKVPTKKEAKTAQNFADDVISAHEKLNELVRIKTFDLATEKDQPEYNQKALAQLKSMRFHFDEILELIEKYGER
jgi:hypothetical protein